MIDARKQVRDALIPLELRSPMSHDRVMDQLRDRSIIICPDANVLRRMMQIKKLDNNDSFFHLKNFEYCLSNIDEWSLQIKACKKLLDMEEVGWVIPEQIVREINNYPAKLVELESCMNSLENTEESLHPKLQRIAFRMVKKIDKLIN